MTVELAAEQVRALRLRAQHLARPGPADLGRLVGEVGGIQAQEAPAAYLALWARSSALTAGHVKAALDEQQSLVRTWCMRGTLHFLAAGDVGWLLPLLGPRLIRRSRRRYQSLGLDEDLSDRALRAIDNMLGAEGTLTRSEVATRLADQGLPHQGQRTYHLLRRAALQGLVCFGPDRDGEATYVRLADWVAPEPALAGEEALAQLARRYLAACGPATPADLAAWSGLPLSKARLAFSHVEADLVAVSYEGSPGWLSQARADWLRARPQLEQRVRFLPAYDPCLLNYRDRHWLVDPPHARAVHPGGGVIRPTLLVDGRVAGIWRLRRKGKRRVVEVTPFAVMADEVVAAAAELVVDLGRFLGEQTEMAWGEAA